MWSVNVLLNVPAWDHPALGLLDSLAEKHNGQAAGSGRGHQSWAFRTKEDAYAFAEDAAVASLETVVMKPELQE